MELVTDFSSTMPVDVSIYLYGYVVNGSDPLEI